MEERFDKFCCPNCGREMEKGFSHGAQRPPLMWYPGRENPTATLLTQIPTAEKCEDLSKGVRFESTLDWFSSSYRPSWYCCECGLLLVDTKTKLGKD